MGYFFFQVVYFASYQPPEDIARILLMASLATSNSSSCGDNFDDWCTRWKIPTSVIQLCNNLGASVPSDLVELDAQRIEKFIQENQLLEIEATRFRRGYQAVVEAMVGVSSFLYCFFVLYLLSLIHSD